MRGADSQEGETQGRHRGRSCVGGMEDEEDEDGKTLITPLYDSKQAPCMC
jgi:hypothetical protein